MLGAFVVAAGAFFSWQVDQVAGSKGRSGAYDGPRFSGFHPYQLVQRSPNLVGSPAFLGSCMLSRAKGSQQMKSVSQPAPTISNEDFEKDHCSVWTARIDRRSFLMRFFAGFWPGPMLGFGPFGQNEGWFIFRTHLKAARHELKVRKRF